MRHFTTLYFAAHARDRRRGTLPAAVGPGPGTPRARSFKACDGLAAAVWQQQSLSMMQAAMAHRN
jgi:hypothetical protein